MIKNNETDKTIYLKDYQHPDYWINKTDLTFELDVDRDEGKYTIVKSKLEIVKNTSNNSESGQPLTKPLKLHGQHFILKSVAIDGVLLSSDDYQTRDEFLLVNNVPDKFVLEVETWLKPEENKALEGLYKSSGNFCTQCEAEGFRRITYYLDRPDVMSSFTTRIIADKTHYPVLLSNGNLIEKGELDNGRHYAIWHDPFKKPSYLFALVAGDLLRIADTFTTLSGREVQLYLYVEKQNGMKCQHAMDSLKKSMRWDEETFGLEYDLDIYMIVAVEDFNMGAMENKGLNIFNAKYVLADPESATDSDYEGIEGVIGHEYFHNWTGNRVTCRDWFQLSLKEGLTVFRDQEFTSDMQSRAVKRINDVRVLRSYQFAEDASPMAHPIRPTQYMEINNFYTVTVYNKGAEVIRMMHTMLGQENFREGMDLYFQRHDGQAVTTEDFVAALSDASQIDLSQFQNWYDQAGTPRVKVATAYDAAKKNFTLELQQSCPATPESEAKQPFYIPLKMGLLNPQGEQVLEQTLAFTEAEQSFEFTDIEEKPQLSLLRNFSAPVILESDSNPTERANELAFLMANDTDPFNRWEAGQQLATQLILDAIARYADSSEIRFDSTLLPLFIEACQSLLEDTALDNALKAQAVTLPAESWLLDQLDVADVDAVCKIRQQLKQIMGKQLHPSFKDLYQELDVTGDYQFNAHDAGRRSLRSVILGYLMAEFDEQAAQSGFEHFTQANNMTDSIAALSQLAHIESSYTDQALENYEKRWQDDPLVMDKWFSIQAASQHDNVLSRVKHLMQHPAFDFNNPNKVRSLISVFATVNLKAFHHKNGEAYTFIMDQVLALDKFNPQIAARLVKVFSRWKRFDPYRQGLMKAELERAMQADLSNDVYEIVSKSLL
jgi:aminopeptidase N